MRIKTEWIPFVFVFLWSTGFIGAKYAMPYATPFAFLALRAGLTILAVFGLIAIFSRRFSTENCAKQMLIGALIHGVYLGGVFFAISRGFPAGLSAVIVGLQPIVTSALSNVINGERLPMRAIGGLIVGFVGVLLLIYGRGMGFSGGDAIGLSALFLSLFAIALGTVLQKQWGRGGALLSGSIWQYCGALAAFLLAMLFLEEPAMTMNFQLIAAMIWLVGGLSIGAILLLMVMIREGEMRKVASYFYLVPPLAMLEAWILFGERLSALSLMGAALAVFAIIIVLRD